MAIPLKTVLLLTTDPANTVLARGNVRACYTPFGFCAQADGRFTGQWREPTSYGYMLGAGYRALLPSLMRFDRTDRWSPFGKGGLNAYVYCAAEPVNRLDGTGRFFGSLIKPLMKQLDNLAPGVQVVTYQRINVGRLFAFTVNAEATVQVSTAGAQVLIRRVWLGAASVPSGSGLSYVARYRSGLIEAAGTAKVAGLARPGSVERGLSLGGVNAQALGMEMPVNVALARGFGVNTLRDHLPIKRRAARDGSQSR